MVTQGLAWIMPGFSFTYSPPVYQNTLLMQCLQQMLIFFCVLPATNSCSIWIIFRQKLPCSVRRWHGLCVFFAPFIFPQVCLQTAAWRFYRENWHGSVTIRGKHNVPRSSGRFLLNPGRCCAAVYRLSYTDVTGWILNTYVLVAATEHIHST